MITEFFQALSEAVGQAVTIIATNLIAVFKGVFLELDATGAVTGLTPIAYVIIISMAIAVVWGLLSLCVSFFRMHRA